MGSSLSALTAVKFERVIEVEGSLSIKTALAAFDFDGGGLCERRICTIYSLILKGPRTGRSLDH